MALFLHLNLYLPHLAPKICVILVSERILMRYKLVGARYSLQKMEVIDSICHVLHTASLSDMCGHGILIGFYQRS